MNNNPSNPPSNAGKGRPLGSPNKRSQQFLDTLEANGFDVAKALLELHTKGMELYKQGGTDKAQGLKIAGDMAKEIASYVLPKLKAIEHTTNNALSGMTSEQKLEAMKQAVQLLEREVSDNVTKKIENK